MTDDDAQRLEGMSFMFRPGSLDPNVFVETFVEVIRVGAFTSES